MGEHGETMGRYIFTLSLLTLKMSMKYCTWTYGYAVGLCYFQNVVQHKLQRSYEKWENTRKFLCRSASKVDTVVFKHFLQEKLKDVHILLLETYGKLLCFWGFAWPVEFFSEKSKQKKVGLNWAKSLQWFRQKMKKKKDFLNKFLPQKRTAEMNEWS